MRVLSATVKFVLFVALIFPSPVSAQTPAKPDNVFERMDWVRREQVFKSPLGKAYSPDPNSRRYEASPQGYRSMQLCDGPSCGSTGELEYILPDLQPDKRRHGANIYGPMAGFADTLFSKAHADQLSHVMASPIVLYNTTMMLTEPAVAQGVNNSAMFGLNSINSRYLAEMSFLKGLDAQPDTREIMHRMYNECIASLMRERDRAHDNDATTDRMSWIQAQSLCMADRIENFKDSWGSGENFDALGDRPDGKKPGFSFWDETSHASWLASGSYAEDEEIRLSDYIFNESNIEALGVDASELEDVKYFFTQLMGDYIFTVDKPSGTAGRSSSREIKYNKIKPEKTFEEIYRQRFLDIFKEIMKMVHGQCMYDPAANQNFQNSNLYCTKGGSNSPQQDDFIFVSSNGYQFDCAMLAMLWLRFKADFPEIANKECGNLDPASAASDPQQLFDNQQNIKTGHRAVAFLASKIALGQMYSTAMHINSVLNSMSSHGGIENFVQSFGQQLVYSALGSHNLMEDYVAIMNSINNEFRPEIQKVSTIDSGTAAPEKVGGAIADSQQQHATGGASAR